MRGQEVLVVREQGSHSPTSTSGSWMGEEQEGGEFGVCSCIGGMFRSHVNKT